MINEITIDELHHTQFKTYVIDFSDSKSLDIAFQSFPDSERAESANQLKISINDEDLNRLISVLSKCRIGSLREEKHTLEEYFMKFYGGNGGDKR